MNYEIENRPMETMNVVYQYYQGVVKKAGQQIPRLYRSEMGKVEGACLYHYLSFDVVKGTAEIEVCLPTQQKPKQTNIMWKVLPERNALHYDAYDNMKDAYQALSMYATEHQISLDDDFYEVYHKGPGRFFKGNENQYITEIMICIKEEADERHSTKGC